MSKLYYNLKYFLPFRKVVVKQLTISRCFTQRDVLLGGKSTVWVTNFAGTILNFAGGTFEYLCTSNKLFNVYFVFL